MHSAYRPTRRQQDGRARLLAKGREFHGWKGGWGFGTQSPSLGRYVVSFECAGQRTAGQTFEVILNPFSPLIDARWIFFDAKSGGDVHERGALLHLENKTERVLRFAKPGFV